MAITKATASSIAPAAKGDLVVGSATNDASVLAVGSANQVLTVDSSTATGLKWAAPAAPSFVGCSVNYNADLSIANTTTTVLPWNGELFDTDGFHDNSTNNTRITIPTGKGGYYLCFFHFKFNNNATGTRIAILRKNGSTTVMQSRNGGFSSSFSYLTLSGVFNLSAADYIEVTAYQDTGGNLNAIGGTNEGMFGVQYLGA
jgi:hypothetical protein